MAYKIAQGFGMRRSQLIEIARKHVVGGLEFDRAGLLAFVKELRAIWNEQNSLQNSVKEFKTSTPPEGILHHALQEQLKREQEQQKGNKK